MWKRGQKDRMCRMAEVYFIVFHCVSFMFFSCVKIKTEVHKYRFFILFILASRQPFVLLFFCLYFCSCGEYSTFLLIF